MGVNLKKIGIITFHTACNYGAILQAYALNFFLNEKYDCQTINYMPKYFEDMYVNHILISRRNSVYANFKCIVKWILVFGSQLSKYKKLKRFRRFQNNMKLSKPVREKAELRKIEKDYDYILVGSDQVWNMKISNFDTTFLLDFVPKEKSLSYAASFGKSVLNETDKKYLFENIYNFSNYLVRETAGLKILEDDFDIKGELVCDPTLLLSSSQWDLIAKKSSINSHDFILIYLVASPTKIITQAIEYAQRNELPIYVIGNYKIKYKKTRYFNSCSPEDFVNLIKSASKVFTTSYHGIMFSLIYNKDFIYELNHSPNNNNSRIEDVISKLQLDFLNIDNENVFQSKIDWKKVNNQIQSFIEDSQHKLLNYFK